MGEVAAIASTALPIIGGMLTPRGDNGASQSLKDAISAYSGIPVPNISEQELQAILPQLVGSLTPQLENAEQLGTSQMENIQTDPRLKQAQMNALDTLTKVGAAGGMTDADKAMLNQVRRRSEQDETARQAGIMQEMAQRGKAGGGDELAARLLSSQSATNRASQAQEQQAIEAANRALSAMQQAGVLGGQAQQQEFGQKAQQASAADVINKFNTGLRQDVQHSNVAAQNAAQQRNLAEQQRVADEATRLRNAQQEHNKGLLQTQFANRMGQAGGMSAGLQNLARSQQSQADAERERIGNMIGAGSKMLGGLGGTGGTGGVDKETATKAFAAMGAG